MMAAAIFKMNTVPIFALENLAASSRCKFFPKGQLQKWNLPLLHFNSNHGVKCFAHTLADELQKREAHSMAFLYFLAFPVMAWYDDKTRHDKTRQAKPRQDKIRQDKPRQP
jgi:hypothetical protein